MLCTTACTLYARPTADRWLNAGLCDVASEAHNLLFGHAQYAYHTLVEYNVLHYRPIYHILYITSMKLNERVNECDVSGVAVVCSAAPFSCNVGE
jgi:hypothetical protein